jgi:transposase InsO family protein
VATADATRLTYLEVLPDETRCSTTAFLARALCWFNAVGSRSSESYGQRVRLVSRLFRNAVRMLGIWHIRTRPYTPKTNCKAERFIQTLFRSSESGLRHSLRSSDAQAADLPQWLAWYNQHRPHVVLAD